MKGRVLVLNQDYTPLTVCSVNRTFLLVFMNKADLLTADKDEVLRSISQVFPKPSVIKIKRYINVPYRGVVLTRNNVFKRDGYQCQYCGTSKDLTLDHVIPRSKGGKSTWTNLITACKRCNAKKGDYSLEKVGMKLFNVPTKPSYIMFLKDGNGNLKDEWRQYLEPKLLAVNGQ